MIRSPICSVVGHVDHGKTSILDFIRGTSVAKGEAGGITQCISCTSISLNVIKKICGDLLKKLNINFTIPGLLFIDTPGHAAFTNLRKRGGNLADIAVLVVDINEGLKEQSLESIEILKQYKTPFVIAANKLDLLPSWKKNNNNLIININNQAENIRKKLDDKLYGIVGRLSEIGFNSERFDRVDNYTKQVAIIPVSAKTGEGIAELLMVLAGLAQKYLEENLKIEVKGIGKAIVLEVKEERGLGVVLDLVLYDGHLKVGDQIVIGDLNQPIVTKVRSIFCPKAVKKIYAATVARISAPNIKDVVAGMPLMVANENLEKIKGEIQKEVEEVLIETDKKGIVVKADSLGSLEALVNLLKKERIAIKKASIGDISKKDIMDAKAEMDNLNKIVIGFNVKGEEEKEIKIIKGDVIYKIIEDYKKWIEEEKLRLERKEMEKLVKPCKLQILRGCMFRQSHPAIVGVIVLGGSLKTGIPLIKENGDHVGEVKSMQSENKNIQEAEKGKEIAISLPQVICGRQIHEEDILLSDISEEDFIKLKKLKKYLNSEEIEILKEVSEIKRKQKPMWGI